MSNESRLKKSARNLSATAIEQVSYTLISFICRTVFIYTLGSEYLGYSGLFGDVLSLLSLGELGIGTAITYFMYKPMALHDNIKISALLNYYKNIYRKIGIAMTGAGLLLVPFLDFFVSGIVVTDELVTIYVLYLLNTTISYFFSYRNSILVTDQKSYISSFIFTCVNLLQNTLQMIFLLVTKNFIVYLIIQICGTYLNNYIMAYYVGKHYPFIVNDNKSKIDNNLKYKIKRNIKAIFLSRVSSVIVTSTDNILISKFVSTIVLGVYSNYVLFVGVGRTLMTKIFQALTGSVGNMIAKSSLEHIYEVYKKVWFINFWLIAVISGLFFILINQFIQLWAGEEYLLSTSIVLLIAVNMYFRFIRNTFLLLQDTMGLFKEMQNKSIAEAVINLSASLFFVMYFETGLEGILLGTFISNITTNFWYEPWVIYKKIHAPYREYITTFIKYLVAAVSSIVVAWLVTNFLILSTWLDFFLQLCISFLVINLFLTLIFYRSNEFLYFKDIICRRLGVFK